MVKGYKHSEETKKKLSESKKGSKNPAYGKSSWNSGLTKETDERVAKNAEAASKGSRHLKPSDELRKFLSDRWKGDNNPAKNPEILEQRVKTRYEHYENYMPDDFVPWCQGLTKEDDVRLRIIGEKNRDRLCGKPLLEVSKEKLIEYWQDIKIREIQSKKITEKWKDPLYREMMGIAREGKYLFGNKHPSKNPENLAKLPRGERHWNWHGGLSFADYYTGFTNFFKERIRNNFNRKCSLCNISETDIGEFLSVHHINYDKNTICDENEWLFIPLCRSCHMKTGFDRYYWFNILANQWAINSEINLISFPFVYIKMVPNKYKNNISR